MRQRSEMAHHAQLPQAQDQQRRQHPLEKILYFRLSHQHQHTACHQTENTSRHLALGEGGDAGADSEKNAGHQPATEITKSDHPIIRRAEIIDRQPDRKGQRQSNSQKQPAGKKLSQHRLRRS
ncbi:hypothetical protein RF55_15354 [Lasius niger]|uniref:Uncharacterized protein n=1 Tax=Lasius niger TaxID=67767 RepID=A0A0J7K5T9_LASNI|nr:hypothetical protein RF55_15354 [Lasius niger]